MDLFNQLAPRDDPPARLLLLLAKAELSKDQRREARSLAKNVSDWEAFAQIAARKFAVTFVQRHLQSCAEDLVPLAVREKLRQLARSSVMAALRTTAAQVAFHQRCIQPTGARHAYVKGAAIAVQNAMAIGDRFCRDVDVLVASKDFRSVIDAAASSGYRVLMDSDSARFAVNAQDLSFLCRYADVVTLIGPDSVPIEVHRRLDKLSLNFDLERAFASTEDVELAGITVQALSKPLHFAYICYHHSRHFWSHLHWLADIDAMIRSPDFDREKVQTLADSIGIRPTIDATLEFHELVSRPGLWGSGPPPTETGGGQFLKACLVNLDGDLDLEAHLRQEMKLNDFMSAWQVSAGRYGSLWFNSWRRRLRPSVTQYVARRYPSPLHWIYSLENAGALAKNALTLAGAAAVRLPKKLARSRNRPSSGNAQ